MKAVIQRVKSASVSIKQNLHSQISAGLLVLLGVQKGDSEKEAQWLASKICALRLFEDENQKMNLSVKDINGELLTVSQFTLLADCKKGTRPGFDSAAHPEHAKQLYEFFIEECKKSGLVVKSEHMDVEIINHGPVTIVLEKTFLINNQCIFCL